jgi:hypothetical protein
VNPKLATRFLDGTKAREIDPPSGRVLFQKRCGKVNRAPGVVAHDRLDMCPLFRFVVGCCPKAILERSVAYVFVVKTVRLILREEKVSIAVRQDGGRHRKVKDLTRLQTAVF